MDDLTNIKYYIENGQNHESCDLTDLVFKDIDYTQVKENISFFRSDFSRSRFYSCSFSRNAFGRADFIDVYIKSTDFENVDFGSCLIKNAFLERVMFSRNHYRGVAIQYSNFKKCVFRDENFITNMYNCEFYECTFINCTFKKSSLDSNLFSNCEFIKVDISECSAENLKFEYCSLRDVYLSSSLWTTYLYKNTDINCFGFKCRGEVVDIWNGDANEFVDTLFNKKLYYEYLNAIIIGDLIPKCGLVVEFKRLFPLIMSQADQIRKSTIIKILDMLFFYQNYDKIPFQDYLDIYGFFANINWDNIPFEESLIYNSKLYKIQKSIEHLNFDLSHIRSIKSDSISISKFHINCDDTKTAVEYLERVFETANNDICGSAYEKPLIKVIQAEKGSVILTIASATVLVLLVSYVAKKVLHNVFSIQIENKLKQQLIAHISSNTDLSDLKKSCSLAQKHNFLPNDNDSTQINKLSADLTKGEILDIIINLLV